MSYRTISVCIAGLLVTSLVTGIAAADPPRPGTEDNGLTENESATLWSRDADTYITQEEYQARYGESRTAVQQAANGTDITFKRPPATAATWTRNDFADLTAGGPTTAIHPPHADLENGRFIADAHATIFAVHPATRGHLDANRTPLYVAPNGTVRGLVDYRIRMPNGSPGTTDPGGTTSNWSIVDHNVDEVRLRTDRNVIAETAGSQTPTVDYDLEDEWRAPLTLEAEISVRVKQTTRADNGSGEATTVTYHTESLTVSDSITVAVYDPAAHVSYADYPNGDTGVAIFQSRPWQGYTVTDDGDARVRGIWRFYTARDTNWDTLVYSSRTGTTTVESDAIPVYVHAYPSRIGPRVEPVRGGPELTDTWGTTRSAPPDSIGENVTVDVVTRSYTPTDGVAVRAAEVDREALHVAGLVRGVNASIIEPDASDERQLRRSTLSTELSQQNRSHATLRIELQENQTGAPIVLDEGSRSSDDGYAGSGYITVGDRRVETNASGVATVTLDEPGIYTARYQPGSWLGHDPAYLGDSTTTRWHPLGTIEGWFSLLIELGWQLLPFAVMFYAGKHLLRLLGPEDVFQRRL